MSDSRKEGIDKLEKGNSSVAKVLQKKRYKEPMLAWWRKIFLILNEFIYS